MQAFTQRTLQSLLRTSTRPARTYRLHNVRPYICAECFHKSRTAQNSNKEPAPVLEETEQPLQKPEENVQAAEVIAKSNATSPEHEPTPEEVLANTPIKTTGGEPSNDSPPRRPRGRPIGSRIKRISHPILSIRAQSPPKPKIPEWYIEEAIFGPSTLARNAERVILVDDIIPETHSIETGTDAAGNSGGQVSAEASKSEAVDNATKITTLGSNTAVTNHESDAKTVESSEIPQVSEQASQTDSSQIADASTSTSPSGSELTSTSRNTEATTSDPMPTSITPETTSTLDGVKATASNLDSLEKDNIPLFTPNINSGADSSAEGSTAIRSPIATAPYLLNKHVYEEILAQVRGSLMLPKAEFDMSFFAAKCNVVLVFPQEDGASGTYFLDAVSEKLAAACDATLVRIDAQDIEELAGDFLGDSKPVDGKVSPISAHILRTLGYQAQLQHQSNKNPDEYSQEQAQNTEQNGEEAAEEEEEEEEDNEDHESEPARTAGVPSMLQIQNLLGAGKLIGAAVIRDGVMTPIGPSGTQTSTNNTSSIRNKILEAQQAKLNALLSAMIDSHKQKNDPIQDSSSSSKSPSEVTKTSTSGPTTAVKPESKKNTSKSKIIINVRDYRELERIPSGEAILMMLVELVQERRRNGQEIMILGTSCLRYSARGMDKPWLNFLQRHPAEGVERTIIVPTQASRTSRIQITRDRSARLSEINMRHLADTIRRRSGDGVHAVKLKVPPFWHLEAAMHPQIPGIDKWIWDEDKVHRIALTVLGKLDISTDASTPRIVDLDMLANAVKLLNKSDELKLKWATESTKQAQLDAESGPQDNRSPEERNKQKIEELTKICNSHEKKLLGGVINPESIRTGFEHIRAPENTIDAMKTLTSLSLQRPEAFKYGVLASDRIPGVLLYGPPGTGKTLLAKAVAKESGATVLEVSGSEVFDMYVGEAEKNVKAIFTLAKKLSPCVVFIDEADAIFGSRQSHSTRTTHRELINQFLKEWDGMAQTTAFMMVATNRPFDLDDAVLRRLPRRILVDLPTFADRLAILKIHLAEEDIAPDVDLKDLASDAKTNLYSGSDLKNLSVAAALNCVREENEAFSKTGTYPEKRKLEQRHFDKALSEISASISEDMGSLGLIRKFDEKYGEKAGRKKKASSWGFGSADSTNDPKEKGSGRVRK